MAISAGGTRPIRVRILKPIFSFDFPCSGMQAWLTRVAWNPRYDCYHLFFDFTEFEVENRRYFRNEYYANGHTPRDGRRSLFTALEAGYYTPFYDVFFVVAGDERDDAHFEQAISQYLEEIQASS